MKFKNHKAGWVSECCHADIVFAFGSFCEKCRKSCKETNCNGKHQKKAKVEKWQFHDMSGNPIGKPIKFTKPSTFKPRIGQRVRVVKSRDWEKWIEGEYGDIVAVDPESPCPFYVVGDNFSCYAIEVEPIRGRPKGSKNKSYQGWVGSWDGFGGDPDNPWRPRKKKEEPSKFTYISGKFDPYGNRLTNDDAYTFEHSIPGYKITVKVEKEGI